jgi:hypothetical protein
MFGRVACLCLGLLLPSLCSAQEAFESVGSRALGMAGAFVAVANDSTAVYWNPAGLVKGGPGGMTINFLNAHTGPTDGPPIPGATKRSSRFYSVGSYPIGFSYGRFYDSALVATPGGATRMETLGTWDLGATFLQSVTQGVVVGSTLRYIRGTAVSAPVESTSISDALDQAKNLEGPSSGHMDLDVGTMVDMGVARFGLTVRNLLEPTFTDPAGPTVTMKRHARMGLAILPTDGFTFAIDYDLDADLIQAGPRRVLALGLENRFGNRFAIRAGIRRNIEGGRHSVLAVGASLALRRGFWVDGHYTRGRDLSSDHEFGFALRAGL